MLLMEVSKWWKIVQISKISVKMNNFRGPKHFVRPKQRYAITKLWSPAPDKNSYVSVIKIFSWREIYWNVQTFVFQVLRECSSWTSRNGSVQKFFLRATRNMFTGKFVKRVRFFSFCYFLQCWVSWGS